MGLSSWTIRFSIRSSNPYNPFFNMHFLTYALVPQLVSALAITQRDTRPRALYFVDADASGCSVASMKISVEDGTLSDIAFTPTGQKGAVGLDAPATPGAAAAPGGADPLFSQNSIIVGDDVSLRSTSVLRCELIRA
jgi:hypothetical protein